MTRDSATSRARGFAGYLVVVSERPAVGGGRVHAGVASLLLSAGVASGVFNTNGKDANMTEPSSPAPEKKPSGAAKMFGDFAPALVSFTDDTLFGQVCTRLELSPRDRSLVTVTALATAGNTEQLTYHLGLARQNGLAETELIEAVTHLAFYVGWPRARSAMAVAKQVLGGNHDDH